MMILNRFFLFIPLFLFLLGCASKDSQRPVLGYHATPPDSSESRLVIYREPVFEVEEKSPHLYINNESQGRLKNNHYMIVPTEAGSFKVTVKKVDSLTNLYGEDEWPVRPKSVDLTIEDGQEKFIRYTVRINNSVFYWYDAVFEEVSREQALIDLDFMALQKPETEE